MALPVVLISGVTWSFGHISLLPDVPWRTGVALSFAAVRRGHPWLAILCGLTAVAVVSLGAAGAYWYVVAGGLWVYYYAAIAALRTA